MTRNALAAVLSNKAMSDRAAKLDQDIAATRSRLERAPAVASVDPRAELLARIFSLGPDAVATAQQIATVVVVELLMAFAIIAWELLAAPSGGRQDGGADRDAAVSTDTAAQGQSVDSEASADGATPAAKPARTPVDTPSRTAPRPRRGRRLGQSSGLSKEAAGKQIVDTLQAQGGRIEGGSVRGIAKLLGVSKSTVHNALAGLIAGGIVAKAAGGALVLTGAT